MPFNANGIWVEPTAYWATPEGQAEQLANQQRASEVIGGTGQGGYAPQTGVNDPNLHGLAAQHASVNSPEWQAALNAYNTGQAVPEEFRGYIQHLAEYYKQGQAAPGKLTTETAKQANAQWNQDSSDSPLSHFVDWATPALIGTVGGMALAGYGAAGAAGAEGAGATAAGGGLTAEAAGSTAAMTPEAYAAATGAGYGTTGTAASVGLGTLAANAGGDSETPAPAPTNTGNSSTVDPNTLSSLIQGGSALWAGQQGVDAANKATDELRRQFDIGQANTKPWLEAGKNALGAQQDLMGLGANGPEAQLSSLMNSPGYQFRLNTGRRNLEAGFGRSGGMGSGKAMTGMEQYGQDYASNEYGNRLNQLAGVSGTGQVQANQNMNTGMNYAGEMGNASLAGAQARQSGILGAGSALSNWLNPQPKQLTLADLLRSQ